MIYTTATLIVDSKLTARACSTTSYLVKYGVGAKVYILKSAQQGRLESVYIKKYVPTVLGGQLYMQYKDTLNCIWMENELCGNEDAVNYALYYWRYLQDHLNDNSATD